MTTKVITKVKFALADSMRTSRRWEACCLFLYSTTDCLFTWETCSL